MVHLSETIRKLEEQAETLWKKNKERLPKIFGVGIAILYFYGMLVRSVSVGIQSVWQKNAEPLFTWNPFLNIGAVFSPQGIMITLFLAILYCLFTKKPANKSQEKKQKIEQVHCGGKRHNKKSGERRFFQKLSAFKVSSLRSSPIQAESKAS